jgi:glycosyltransferase involved in cell wall biosynthesis
VSGGPGDRPLVSVCVPVLNGGELVARAVRSALDQDYPCVEVVVVDDGSTDGTAANLIASFGDSIAVVRNMTPTGHGRALNRALAHTHGELVKFLDHDDVLDASCVSRLVEALAPQPTAGLAFCRRRLEVAGVDDGEQPHAVHGGFTSLAEFNRGGDLLDQLVRDEVRSNWIGEPVAVMVRRDAIATVGGFSVRTRHYTDFDLWLRILTRFDAIFVDEELVTYRRSAASMSARNAAMNSAWMDRVWILEALTGAPDVQARYPELERLRDQERRIALRTAARSVITGGRAAPVSRWFEYLSYRATRWTRRPELIGHPV